MTNILLILAVLIAGKLFFGSRLNGDLYEAVYGD